MGYRFESVLKSQNLPYSVPARRAMGSPPVIRVAFVLMEHFSMMAFSGAIDALVTANLMSESPVFEILTVGLDGTRVVSDLGYPLVTDIALDALHTRQDLLMVAGGLRVALSPNPALRRKLQAVAVAGGSVGGLWNGAYFMAEARLLDGYGCAFHPDGRAMMAEAFPKVAMSDRNYLIDRGRASCAGARSSLGMMLELVRSTQGDALSRAVEEVLRCDESAQHSGVSAVALDSDPTLPQAIKVTLELMQKNIEEPLGIEELATCARISRRQLERRFMRFVGASPTRYYLELRLTRARQLVLQTNRPMVDIAVATGFISLPHFQKRFRDFFGSAPGSYRATYERRRATPTT